MISFLAGITLAEYIRRSLIHAASELNNSNGRAINLAINNVIAHRFFCGSFSGHVYAGGRASAQKPLK